MYTERVSKVAIAIACDEKYLPYAKILISQLSDKTSTRTIFVLFDGAHNLADQLIQFGASKKFDLKVIEVTHELNTNSKMRQERHVSRATYARLLLADLLPLQITKVLYLDIDILVLRDLDVLTNTTLKSPIAAVIEQHGNGESLFNSPDVNYFNAGILVIDLNYWRQNQLNESIQAIFDLKHQLPFQDQDVLNLAFRGDWQLLPLTSNVFAEDLHSKNSYMAISNPIIVHFNGPNKPWNSYGGEYHQLWREHANQNGFKDFDISDSWRAKLRHYLVYNFRYSAIGIKLRRAIPQRIKFGINEIMFKVLKN